MKCFNCGAELTDGTKFCSYCGAKIESQGVPEEEIRSEPKADHITEKAPTESHCVPTSAPIKNGKNGIGDKAKEKAAGLWGKLTLYGKISTIAIAAFALMCFVAFVAGKTFAGIVAVIAVVLVIVALLMKKQIIKTPKSWLHIVALILAFVLIIPYVALFRVDYVDAGRWTDHGETEKLEWSDIILGNIAPEPKSLLGKIFSNTDTYLNMNIDKTSQEDYDSYVEACKGNGFTVDAEESGTSFTAYNPSGYTASLLYYNSDSKMNVDIERTKEYGALVWPDNEIARVLPTPTSTTGEIIKDDETGVQAYVNNTSMDDFKTYIASCVNMGFTIDANDEEKTYSAKNSAGNTLSVEYQGNHIIFISVGAPQYAVTIKVDFVGNLIFSKYDVDVLIDDNKEGTLTHGTDAEYEIMLGSGEHTITFAEVDSSSAKGSTTFVVSGDTEQSYKIACYSDKITVEDLKATLLEEQQAQAAEEARIAAEAEEAAKVAEALSALEAKLPQEMAKRASIVAITNYVTASDVFMSDGNTLDSSKFHSYADTSGNFFNYYIGVGAWGEWSIKDENTWHVETMSFENCFGNVKNAALDVRYDGANYIVSNVVITFGDLSDPSKSGIEEYSDEFVVASKLVQDNREQTRLDSYNSWVDNQFSLWDGSHTVLVSLIKESLNDRKSFDHIETTYRTITSTAAKTEVNDALKSANSSQRVEIGDLFVSTEFTAKNAFNATIKNTAYAVVSFAENTTYLISIG